MSRVGGAKRRWIAITAAAVIAVIALIVGPIVLDSAGSKAQSTPSVTAASFSGFALYGLGQSFEGLPLTDAQYMDVATGVPDSSGKWWGPPVHSVRYFQFVYGTCTPTASQETGCAPPVEIQVWPACERTAIGATASAGAASSNVDNASISTTSVRGVTAAVMTSPDQRVEVATGGVTVVIWASDTSQELRAAQGLTGMNSMAAVVGTTRALPKAAASSGGSPC